MPDSRASEERFRALIQNSSDIITIHDVAGTTVYETPSAARILGYPRGGLIGKSPFDSIHPKDVGATRTAFEAVVAGSAHAFPVEFRFRHADGSWIWLEAVGSNHLNRRGIEGIVLTSRDITARKEAEQRIHYLANHDVLTGLPNRFLMEDRLQHALAQAQESRRLLGLILINIDQFKRVNDSYGHHAGDELLQEVARRVKACTREGDTVARIGGDSYAVVLPDTGSVEHASDVAQRILAEIARPAQVAGSEIFVTASAGLSLWPTDSNRAEDLLSHAETAMQSAKRYGRNTQQFFTAELNALMRERIMLEDGLRKAVERSELRLHYQPKFSVATGCMVGVEALLRWQHPLLGLILPERFVALAEETGLIVPVGEWVLREACTQARAWHDAGLDLSVAVNLSPRQFRDGNLATTVAQILRATGALPERLEVEITESVLIGDAERAVLLLHDLKSLGVTIAIDDFGTGYSSLAYLNRFPLDVLKIDQSFVAGIDSGDNAATIVKAILALTKSLGLLAVAEGVETSTQRDFLAAHGCDFLQGMLLSCPLEPQDISAMRARLAPARLAG